MKTEFVDVSETQKNLIVEIPTAVVDAEIERVTRDYSRAARIPGFRPGKVPKKLVRQRFHDQILHDVAHDLIPRAVDEALRERGQEPVGPPDIRDVSLEEGQPLKFTAMFETVPPIDPGDYDALVLRKRPTDVQPDAVDDMLKRLQERAARYEPVEDRPADEGDTVTLDLTRRPIPAAGGEEQPEATRHENVTAEIGSTANPPGFDDHVRGLTPGDEKAFVLTYPPDYTSAELAGTQVEYTIVVKAIKRKVLPELDDEFARDMGDFESLDALRQRIEEDLRHEAAHEADRDLRADLVKQLAQQVTFELPGSLIDREVDRRTDEFVRRLSEQQIDPMRAGINWEEFRERQREPAIEAVRGALVLDEVARREGLTVAEADLEQEVNRYAERSGRTASAVRARLEKEGGIARLYAGLRRDKAIDFLLTRAKIITA